MKTPPLKAVKDRFGDKQKLVSAVNGLATDELWLKRVNGEKGLDSVSNAKLLRLHDTLTQVKKEFGSRAKLIESILTLSKRSKDAGLKSSLEKFPTPRLIDLQTSAARRAKAAKPAATAKAVPKKKKARSKKAKAKAAAPAAPATPAAKKK
ncbi:MAG TPA: hypothetical protein VF395_09675 [Polyangiaceae bacterium]